LYSLYIHDDAKADLAGLLRRVPRTAGRIVSVLKELAEDQDLLDRLTQHDFGKLPPADFHVSRWVEQWNKGRNLWRIKVWDLEDRGIKYRIVYASVPNRRQYHVLGVVPRSFNYEEDHPLTRRILAAHDDL
jgi:hypothetical protein